MSSIKKVHGVLIRHRAVINWALPCVWALTLLVPTTVDYPWQYLILCLIAFAFALRNGFLAFAALEYRLGLMWFLAGATVLIINFAELYHDTGLVEHSTQREVSLVEAIYFSIVTWTTLGYGDLSPPPSIRLYAACEALLGYMYMAVAVGITVNLLGTLGQTNGRIQTTGTSRRR